MSERGEALLLEHGSTVPDYDSDKQKSAKLDPASTYDHVADFYDEFYDSRICHAENRIIGAMLRDVLPPDRDIVDVGCGTGLLLDLFPDDEWSGLRGYLGIDPCAKMLEKLKERHPNANILLAHYGEVEIEDDAVIVGLFGVPNYIEPSFLDIPNLKSYFLMFYRPQYRPSYYYPPRNEPYLGFAFYEYALGDSYVTRFSNYIIVTDLL